MRNTLILTLFAGVLAVGAAFGSAPAAAQPQGYFGPGRDGDYQPPAFDRDRVALDTARSAGGGGGLYGGPLYDREPHGYGYSVAGSIDQGALRTAWIALGRAETRLLTRVTTAPQGEQAAQGGAIGAIRSARQALTEREVELAAERAMALARHGDAVGGNVSGAALTGAGTPDPGQPLTGGGSAGDQARQ